MTYTERLQKESKELAAVFIAEGLATPVCGEDCIRLEKSLEPIVIHLLAKQAEAYEEGYKQGDEDQYNRENSTRLFVSKPIEQHLQSLGYVPQITTNEKTK